MAATHLLFESPATSAGEQHLVFGNILGMPDEYDVAISGTFPFTVSAIVGALIPASIVGVFPGFTLDCQVNYNVNVSRPTVGKASDSWQIARRASIRAHSAVGAAAKMRVPTAAIWQDAAPAQSSLGVAFDNAVTLDPKELGIVFQDGEQAGTQLRGRLQDGLRDRRLARTTAFQDGSKQPAPQMVETIQDGYRDRRNWRDTLWQDADKLHSVRYTGSARQALKLRFGRGGRFQNAIRPPPGIWIRPGGPGEEDHCYDPVVPAHLLFVEPAAVDGHLLFRCFGYLPGATQVIPVRRVYIVQNQVTLRRVSDDLPIHAREINLSLDTDSWTWTWDAAISPAQLADIQKEGPMQPRELEVTINGHAVRVLAEDIEREREFGRTELRVRGRGISGMLSKKYTPVQVFANTAERTIQQIANDVLTVSGVPIGWDVQWNLADWIVPADVWNHQGDYMSALNEIAAAAGGYVQPHNTDQVLRFLKRYPILPWDWASATPDIEIPADIIKVEGFVWDSKPIYNRVFVRGMKDGVLVQATRMGSAGELEAPMITDSLITHVDGGRARAEPVLADVGDQTQVRLRTLILPETGFIMPGKLVRYVDDAVTKLGLARSIRISANHAQSWQTVEVETHDNP